MKRAMVLVVLILCLRPVAATAAAAASRKAALVKEAVILSNPQDGRSTDILFDFYEKRFSEQELERLVAFLRSDVGTKFLAAAAEEKKWLLAQSVTDPAAELQKSKERGTRAAIRAIASALITRSLDTPRFPQVSSIKELAAVLEPKYIDVTPRKDDWGGELLYIASPDGSSYRIVAPGPDGRISPRNRSLEGFDPDSDDFVFQDSEFLHPPRR